MAHHHRLQKAGVFLTVLCAVHCLATPIILTSLPFLAGGIHPLVEIALVVAGGLLGIFMLKKDFNAHQNPLPFTLFFMGFLMQIAGLFFGESILEKLLMLTGGFCILTAYYINWTWHKRIFHKK